MVAEHTPVTPHWTYTELQAMENERRIELYDGELVEMASPTVLHQELIARLFLILRLWVQEHSWGRVYLSPVDLYVSETKCYIPDLMFFRSERYATERIEREDDACIIAPPDLAVEILSPSTARNDRIRKANIYAEFGVTNYWLIDPEAQTLQAFTLDKGRYAVEANMMVEETFSPTLFPGLQIQLMELLA